MNIRWLAVCALLACGKVSAYPLVVERNQDLGFRASHLAHAGNELISLAIVSQPACATGNANAARLYTRNAAGEWNYTRTLATECTVGSQPHFRVDMTADIAVFSMPSRIHIFERGASGWVEQQMPPGTSWPRGPLVSVSGGQIFATHSAPNGTSSGSCDPNLHEIRKLGMWSVQSVMSEGAGTCVTALDSYDNQMIFVAMSSEAIEAPRRVSIWEPDELGWRRSRLYEIPGDNDGDGGADDTDDSVGSVAAIRGDLALVGNGVAGAFVYRKISANWTSTGILENPGTGLWGADASIDITDEYVLRVGGNAYRASGAGYLYQRQPDGSLRHLINFVGNNDRWMTWASMVGDRVLALTGDFGNLPVEFEVPADIYINPLQQEDFEGAPPLRWSLWPNTVDQFAVANNGNTNVYRQASLEGDAFALYHDEWADQSIAADIRINAFNGADRWVGLMTRWTNENYYYVTLRDTNRVSLRKMVDGTFTELASVNFDIQPGQTWNVRLESQGTEHSVYLHGQLVLRVWDDSLPFRFGRPGLLAYKAAADYDNVVMSAGPTTSHTYTARETSGGNWMGGPRDFVQESLAAGDSRWLTGTGAEDVTVQALVTAMQFSPTGSSWVGLIARYVDSDNYYYVTVRRDNTLSLRRLVNGAITVLGTVPFQIPANGMFQLRLEAVRDRLRVFVGELQVMEYAGADLVSGKAGAMTYRARANFGAYTAYEP